MNKSKLTLIFPIFGFLFLVLRRFVNPGYGKYLLFIVCILFLVHFILSLAALKKPNHINTIGNPVLNVLLYYGIEVLKLCLFGLMAFALYYRWS